MPKQLKQTNSGLKIEGELEEVADFAREVEKTLKDAEVEEETIEGFNYWRPREEDSDTDIKKKTVRAATISETPLERESNGVKEDLSKAGQSALKAGGHLKDASKNAVRPFCTVSIKTVRKIEEKIYSTVMVKFNPYFFDSKEMSADLRCQEEKYCMDVNIPDETHRSKLKGNFEGRAN